MPIRALIFDFDGLMVDTETPALQSWQEIYAEYGVTLSVHDWAATLGANAGFDAHTHLVALLRERDPLLAERVIAEREAILARRQARKDALSAHQSLLPGVADLLAEARAADLPCAVASSSSRRWVEGWLQRLGVRHAFTTVVTADDVTATKPAPDLFLAAAARLGLPPAECLVLEDSPNGIRAARAAGCPVVAIPGAISGQVPLPPADLTLPSLAHTSLAALQDWFASGEMARKPVGKVGHRTGQPS
ncbi:MAG: HAD family hydrolase [Chloroflexus sp.]|nr:HAD family hydrolase [Chloroflexus sp.]